jgi:autotransporter-associated beta strand protein
VILDGPGSVTFAQGNTFSGGTTVKSGAVYLYTSAPRPLGNGDLTLEGGKLTSIYDGVFSLRSDLNWNSAAVIELKLTSNSVSVGKALELSGDCAHIFEFLPGDFVGTESFLVMSVKKGFGDLSTEDFAFTSTDEGLTGTFRISGRNLYFDATRTAAPDSFQPTAVPEPAAWHLILAGLVGIVVFRRMRMA